MRFHPLVLAALTAAGTAAVAPAANAQIVWSAPQRLSGNGSNTEVIASGGVDASGRALAVLGQPTGDDESSVVVRSAPADGTFGPPSVIDDRGGLPQGAVAPDGRAVLAWTSRDGLRVSRGSVDGVFGPPVTLTRAAESTPTLLLAGDGTAVVVNERYVRGTRGRPGRFRSQAWVLPASGKIPAPQDLPGEQVLRGGSATGTDGTLAFVMHTAKGLRVAVRRTGGTALRILPSAARLSDPYLAVAPDGKLGLAGVVRAECGEAACYGRVVVTEARPGADRFGRPRPFPVARRPRPRSEGGTALSGFGAFLSYAAGGRALVAWIEDEEVDPGFEREDAFGRVVVWDGRRRRIVDDGAGELTGGAAAGVGVVLSDVGRWNASTLGPAGLRVGPGPVGQPTGGNARSNRLFAGGQVRSLLMWEARGALRVSFGTTP